MQIYENCEENIGFVSYELTRLHCKQLQNVDNEKDIEVIL